MKQLTFQGYSDDTFSCTGPGIDVDDDDCARQTQCAIRVVGEGGSLLVIGQYVPHEMASGWGITVAPYADEPDDEPMPDWPMRFVRGERGYSPVLQIDAPDDVQVTLLPEGDEEADGD